MEIKSLKLNVVNTPDEHVVNSIDAQESKILYITGNTKKAIIASGYLSIKAGGDDIVYKFELSVGNEEFTVEDMDEDLATKGQVAKILFAYANELNKGLFRNASYKV